MPRKFCVTLSELRHARGLSQREVAEALHISQPLLSHYEKGVREPGLEFVSRACDYYGVTADYMLGRTQRPGATSAELAELHAAVEMLKTATGRAASALEKLER